MVQVIALVELPTTYSFPRAIIFLVFDSTLRPENICGLFQIELSPGESYVVLS